MIGAIICAVICILALVIAIINARAANDSLVLPCFFIVAVSFIGIFIFAAFPAWLAAIIIFYFACWLGDSSG